MQDVLVCIGQRTHNLADDTHWQQQLNLVLERLSENQVRWVVALVAQAVGYGGLTFAAQVTGLDPKTIRTGIQELQNQLQDCPADRVRREGAGRPSVEKKIQPSNRN